MSCSSMVLLISFSEEEDPQTSEVAGGVLPRRLVCIRAPACPEQLHVRGAQNRGGHRRLRDGPRQIGRPRNRPLQHAQGGNDEAAGSASSLSLGAEERILSSSSSSSSFTGRVFQSFESYVQEIGRAGRDGEAAHCHLFLDPEVKPYEGRVLIWTELWH